MLPCSDMRPKYLTPSEVREHMRLLWRCEAALLSLLYTARALPGRSGAAAATDATQVRLDDADVDVDADVDAARCVYVCRCAFS